MRSGDELLRSNCEGCCVCTPTVEVVGRDLRGFFSLACFSFYLHRRGCWWVLVRRIVHSETFPASSRERATGVARGSGVLGRGVWGYLVTAVWECRRRILFFLRNLVLGFWSFPKALAKGNSAPGWVREYETRFPDSPSHHHHLPITPLHQARSFASIYLYKSKDAPRSTSALTTKPYMGVFAFPMEL